MVGLHDPIGLSKHNGSIRRLALFLHCKECLKLAFIKRRKETRVLQGKRT